MRLRGYGLGAGCNASFVLPQAGDAVEVIRLKVWRKGTLVAGTPEVVARLRVKGIPLHTSFFSFKNKRLEHFFGSLPHALVQEDQGVYPGVSA